MSKWKALVGFSFLSCVLFGQIQFNGTWTVDSGRQTDVNENYFEQVIDVNLRYGHWLAGVKYEQFDPAKPQSMMHQEQGVWHKFLSYQKGNFHARLGSFYTTFGKGLVLKAYDYPAIGLDRRLEGVLVEYNHDHFMVKALDGEIYGTDRKSHNPIRGFEFTLNPVSFIKFGGSRVETEMQYDPNGEWNSVYGELNFTFMNLYGEHAFEDNGDGRANYYSANIFIGPVSVLGEWKDYEQFAKADSLVLYNDPPTLVQEHRFILWNRHAYVINAWDELGYSFKVDSPVTDSGMLTVQHNHTELHSDFDVFEESFAILEWDFDLVETLGILGVQEDFGYQYKNFGFEFQLPIGSYHMGMMIEAQKKESIWVDESDQSQALTVDFTFNPKHIVSLIAEHTSAEDSENTSWIGLKYGARWGKNFDTTLFVGSRRKGKICAGGVCIYSPEFEGFELAGKYRFGT
ncbi:MAG: hypothetical protein CSA81_04860 [Acidobacteria bacterium]|nr:MAG: hypothetical protein CSA81_04860 [Acidobacteriota bacterium]PIE91081.1 MAG: hypothetical protein CR997_02880 [Acidobacteriota bacterium]